MTIALTTALIDPWWTLSKFLLCSTFFYLEVIVKILLLLNPIESHLAPTLFFFRDSLKNMFLVKILVLFRNWELKSLQIDNELYDIVCHSVTIRALWTLYVNSLVHILNIFFISWIFGSINMSFIDFYLLVCANWHNDQHWCCDPFEETQCFLHARKLRPSPPLKMKRSDMIFFRAGDEGCFHCMDCLFLSKVKVMNPTLILS